MEIQEIHLKHFGKFEGETLRFHSGVNVIYGENETGKSTICSFIRGMLYGIERSRGRAAKTDEYVLRQPWENSSYFAGGMRFTSGGKSFYLHRSFAAGEKKASLICEDDGEELDVEHGDLKVLLEDVSEETYRNTFYFGNYSGQTDTALAEEIHNYLVNASTGQFSRINVTGALESLKKEGKAREAEKKALVEENAMAARELRIRMEYEQQEIESLLEDERKIREELQSRQEKEPMDDSFTESQVELQTEPLIENNESGSWIRWKLIMAGIAVLGLLMGFIGSELAFKILGAILVLSACLGIYFCTAKEQEEKDEEEVLLPARQQREWVTRKHQEQEKLQKLLSNLEWIVDSRTEKEEILQDLQEEYQNLLQDKKEREKLETEIAALRLARETLKEVAAEIYQEYEDHLNERVSQILSIITGGKYDRIIVDEKLQVKIYSENRLLTLEQVSRGTMEQICFALRIAAGEMLNAGDPLPIILDDAFLTYDDERLNRTLRFLQGLNRQVLLFTCQKREQEIVNARE